tara:strand:- start:220 stop:1095 length:876 start_codon:yes stop_codon:yes gene_type:complete
MNIIITIFIFALVLFIYLHIYYHIKTSNDLEVFEVSNLSKERLEEVCNLRQPLTFYLDINCFNTLNINEIEKTYNSFDIKIRDISGNSNSELYLPIIFHKARTVINKSESYFSEQNEDFLNETSLIKTFKLNDLFLRPPSLMTSAYDYIMGSINVTTPLRYDISYRNFLVVLDGTVTIKLTPPKNKKYLYPDYDYDNLEFKSPINPWNIQNKYKDDFSKIKCLDVNLDKGKLLFIPAYWWYSIKFNSSETVVLNFKYKTYMNNLAILPHYIKYFLQKQNIKHNVIKNIKTI